MRERDQHGQNNLELIRRLAEQDGLHFFGVSDLDVRQDFDRFESWLEAKRHGEMTWLTRHKPVRRDPKLLLEDARVALVFGLPYYLGDRWLRAASHEPPKIAQYARLRDYHKVLRSKLKNVIQGLGGHAPKETAWRIAVDSAPLLERSLANGLGGTFVGKNTCIIHPAKGSFFLLGEILSSWVPDKLHPKSSGFGHLPRSKLGGCGSCKRCQVHCPTGALDQDYLIDARKCLSYWTIEWRGEIPTVFWPWIGRYVFGCDICQLVCPYNRPITPSPIAQTLVKIDPNIDYLTVATMNQATYESLFGGTPMTRAKRNGLRRNAIIAMAARGDNRLKAILDDLLKDADPVITGTAQTAKSYMNQS